MSVSVVTFQTRPEELCRLLRSFASCTLKLSMTVVDNSPTPALAPLVEQYGACYRHTGVNLGFGAGHNLVLREARGRARYHLVVNPDIYFDAGVLETLFTVMEQHPSFGQLMPRVLYPDGQEQRLCKLLPMPLDLFGRRFLGRFYEVVMRRQDRAYRMADVNLSNVQPVPSLSGCFMLLRDDALSQAGLFDERFFLYMEDVDLCRRIGRSFDTIFFPDASVYHGYAKGSYRNRRLLMLHLRSAWLYFNKWGWLRDSERRQRNRLTAAPSVSRFTLGHGVQPETRAVT